MKFFYIRLLRGDRLCMFSIWIHKDFLSFLAPPYLFNFIVSLTKSKRGIFFLKTFQKKTLNSWIYFFLKKNIFPDDEGYLFSFSLL